MKKNNIFFILIIFLFSCSANDEKSDAYGNFLAKEILISAEASGKIIQFDVEQGQILKKNQQIAVIDTVLFDLQKKQLLKKKKGIATKFQNIISEINVLKEQKKVLNIEKKRIENLLKDSAATNQQFDNINGKIRVIEKQINAIKSRNNAVFVELEAIDVQIDILQEQINRSIITSPINATILEKYAESYEITNMGKPLIKIADLTKMELTVYIDGSQLSSIKIGQIVEVFIDKNKKENKKFKGKIIWISQQAEFTPKIIQTKQDRVNLVYAIKILVENDGSLKIGMPAEVNF